MKVEGGGDRTAVLLFFGRWVEKLEKLEKLQDVLIEEI